MYSTNESRRFQTRARLGNGEDGTDLKRWLRAREKFAKNDYVFVANDGNPMGVLLMPYVLRAATKKTRITTVTPHSRRHFVCTRWIKNGGDIPKLKEMTRHKRLETLEFYLHLANDESLKRELNRIHPARGIRLEFRKCRAETRVV